MTNAVTPELQLTPEQALELEKVRAENTASKLELAKLEQQTREATAENQRLVTARTLKDAFQNGPKFYENALIENLLVDIRVDADGKGTAEFKGKRLPIADALAAVAVAWPTLVSDKRTMPKSATDAPTTRARSEFTQAEKIALLHSPGGYDVWEKLPTFPTKNVPIDELTRAEFSRLPVAEKMKITASKGDNFGAWLAHLPREPKKF